MALSEKDILRVLELFEKSGWTELDLQSGDVKLVVSKNGRLPMRVASPVTPAAAAKPPAEVPIAATVAPASVPVDPRWVAVKAPMLGHFYAAPKPGAPPFVSAGQKVAADDTVAILEVMKLMNHVKAGVAGTVARIAVENGDLVEFDQPLFYIDPAR
jgi:acetyl-CoA carboxylase biotin carboxyl carrier protein